MPLTTERHNWVATRVDKTSDALTRAIATDLTSHVFTGREGKEVTLADGRSAVEFISCSYLGLDTHPALVEAAVAGLRRVGVQFSSSRTRMRYEDLESLERMLGVIYGGRHATCFTAVGSVHLGVLPLLGTGVLPSYPVSASGVTFLIERTAHASIQVLRGVLEQIGDVDRFDCEDLDDLTVRLAAVRDAGRTPIVLVDGVGSMGGLIDVAALYDLCAAAEGYLYVDDAHGVSITGEQGAGFAYEEFRHLPGGLPASVILVGSLAKAFGGSNGGFVLLNTEEDTVELRRFGNPLIFGGPIALPVISACRASAELHLDGTVARLQRDLWRNTELFDSRTGGALFNAGTRSPIRGALFKSEEDALVAAARLRKAGVIVTPAFFPTVAKGSGLIRMAVSAAHTTEQIELATNELEVPV
ncbi:MULTISPECIES: aminotransferase class I/II-fold pyridoxal phosphate-dependent enzyme [unclassified Streptomyces]|uniref:aminotransferase class I/II-fold pyridoxal phosphate-dependent enzyme n=1 Tax=unclassified Streptomyces TaxID=2593676 RepID=UPI003648AE17